MAPAVTVDIPRNDGSVVDTGDGGGSAVFSRCSLSATQGRELLDAVTMGGVGALNMRRTALRVMTLVRPELADWSMMVLPDATPGALLVVGGDDVGFHDVITHADVQHVVVGRVLRTGAAEVSHVALEPDATDSLAAVIPHPRLVSEAATLRPADVLSVALTARGVTFGALVLARGQGRGFSDADADFARQVASRAAAGLDGARFREQRSRMATALQNSLRPSALPATDAFAVAARYRPAEEGLDIGGDFYDVDVGSEDWLLSIGDVCGKGIDAAVVTGHTRQSLRIAAHFERQPESLLSAINAVHHGTRVGGTDPFVTMACGRVHPPDSTGLRVDLAVAGHPAPLIVRRDGHVEQPDLHGLALGLRPDTEYDATSVHLAPGDAMVLFTDGIDEAPGDDGCYGIARMRAVAAEHAGMTADVLCDALEHDVMTYLDGRPHDDMALLVLTYPR